MQCDSLQLQMAENQRLLQQVEKLEAELNFIKTREYMLTGLQGEKLIADMLNGIRTARNASYDMVVGSLKIEIKYSRLNIPNPKASTRRWSWTNVLGVSGNKDVDFIVLLGDVDDRFRDLYSVEKNSPFVVFIVHRKQIRDFVLSARGHLIQLVSKPSSKSKGSRLFRDHQFTISDLENMNFLSANVFSEFRGK